MVYEVEALKNWLGPGRGGSRLGGNERARLMGDKDWQ